MEDSSLKPQFAPEVEYAVSPRTSRLPASWVRMAGSAVVLTLDIAVLAAAAPVARFLMEVAQKVPGSDGPVLAETGIVFAFTALVVALLGFFQTYDASVFRSHWKESLRIVTSVTLAAATIGWVLGHVEADGFHPTHAAVLWAMGILALTTGRLVSARVLAVMKSYGMVARRVVVVGNYSTAAEVAQALDRKRSLCEVVGIVTADTEKPQADEVPLVNGKAANVAWLGDIRSLSQVVAMQPGAEVLVAVQPYRYAQVRDMVFEQTPRGTRVEVALPPLLRGMAVDGVERLEGMPALKLRQGPFPWEYEVLKRGFDLVVAVSMLLALAPLMAVIALAVKLESPGPVLFRQKRVGRWGRTFDMLKFRSMRQDAEKLLPQLLQENEAQGPMFKIRRDPRITRVGRIIRRLSLDELPQLFNVLNGTMSLVGPRPPLPNEVAQYKPEHFRRLEAVPGLTGLWQVTRTDFSFDEVMFADTRYIENWSFGLDIAIMLRTIPAVLAARGAF